MSACTGARGSDPRGSGAGSASHWQTSRSLRRRRRPATRRRSPAANSAWAAADGGGASRAGIIGGRRTSGLAATTGGGTGSGGGSARGRRGCEPGSLGGHPLREPSRQTSVVGPIAPLSTTAGAAPQRAGRAACRAARNTTVRSRPAPHSWVLPLTWIVVHSRAACNENSQFGRCWR